MVLTRGRAATVLLAALTAATVGAAPAAASGSTYTEGARTFDVRCVNGVGSVTIDLTYTETAPADAPHSYSLNTTPAQTRSFPSLQGTHTDHVVFGNLAPGNYDVRFIRPDGSYQSGYAQVCGTTIGVSYPHHVVYGQRVTLTGRLSALQYPYRTIAGATLQVYRAIAGTGVSTYVGTVTTGADGTARFAFTATVSAYWNMRWSGNSDYYRGGSSGVPVDVRQMIGVAPTTQNVLAGRTARVYGTVVPAVAGRVVYVQYEDADGVWHNLNRAVQRLQLLPNGQTAVGYVIRFASPRGLQPIRTIAVGSASLAHGTSRVVTVRTG